MMQSFNFGRPGSYGRPGDADFPLYAADELVRLVQFFDSEFLSLETITIGEPAPFAQVMEEYRHLSRCHDECDHTDERHFRIVQNVPEHWLEGYTFKNGQWGRGEHW